MVNFKENEELKTLNHSCAHLMAQAIKHLYQQAALPVVLLLVVLLQAVPLQGQYPVVGLPVLHRLAVTGDRVMQDDIVYWKDKPVKKEEEKILLAFYKPRGIVCTAEKREKNNIVDFIHYPKRIYPIGRLDKDSEGLILMTNDGEIVNKIMRAGNMHEKEYLVTVNKEVTDSFLHGMANGVPLVELSATTRKCKVERNKGAFVMDAESMDINRLLSRSQNLAQRKGKGGDK